MPSGRMNGHNHGALPAPGRPSVLSFSPGLFPRFYTEWTAQVSRSCVSPSVKLSNSQLCKTFCVFFWQKSFTPTATATNSQPTLCHRHPGAAGEKRASSGGSCRGTRSELALPRCPAPRRHGGLRAPPLSPAAPRAGCRRRGVRSQTA